MNKYESVIIINPKLGEKGIKGTMEEYQNMIKGFSKKDVTIEDLGEKKLAYKMQNSKTGYYAVFNFYAKPEDITKLERNYRINENIMKFIVVKQDEIEENDYEEDEV